jgi:DNA-binding NtrC family response regulator
MTQPTLLILDDDTALLETLGRALRRSYRVLLADSAEEAFALLAKERVDLVLSDHHMPTMTGLEFLKQVATRHPDALRLLFTAEPDAAMAIAAINQGDVFRILVKPVSLPELEVALHIAVEKLQIDRENRILRSLVGAHPELSRVFEQQLSRLWGAPAAQAARPAAH